MTDKNLPRPYRENGLWKKIKFLLDPTKESRELLSEIGQQRMRIKKLLKAFREADHWREQYTQTLDGLTRAMGALVWRKDEYNRYVLASPLHCKAFFQIDGTPECLDYIYGKTDDELIEAIYRRNDVQNTFGRMCMDSDNYTKEHGEVCHFLEAGVVDGTQILLYVVKIPQFDEEGKCTGTVGSAWDFSNHSEFMIKMLNRWIFDHRAIKLFREDDVFAYALKPDVRTCDIFAHVCPNPSRPTKEASVECGIGEECNGCKRE